MTTEPDLTRPLLLDMEAFAALENPPALATDIEVPFGDGVYRFFLSDSSIAMIEGRNDPRGFGRGILRGRDLGGEPLGIGTIYSRLCRGRALFKNGAPIMAGMGTSDPAEGMFFRSDIELVIGWGLIGGGDVRAGEEVDDLLERYVVGQPLAPLWTLAFAIVGARLFGREEAPSARRGKRKTKPRAPADTSSTAAAFLARAGV
jgi:hypothetical protein